MTIFRDDLSFDIVDSQIDRVPCRCGDDWIPGAREIVTIRFLGAERGGKSESFGASSGSRGKVSPEVFPRNEDCEGLVNIGERRWQLRFLGRCDTCECDGATG